MGQYRAAIGDRPALPVQVRLTHGTETLYRLLQRPVAPPIPIRLIIDTASKRSSLTPSVLSQLKPESLGSARVETTTGVFETVLYWVRLEFPGTSLVPIGELAVARMPMPPSLHNYHGLIGRDLLDLWHSFDYQGRRGRFTIRDAPGGLFAWLKK